MNYDFGSDLEESLSEDTDTDSTQDEPDDGGNTDNNNVNSSNTTNGGGDDTTADSGVSTDSNGADDPSQNNIFPEAATLEGIGMRLSGSQYR